MRQVWHSWGGVLAASTLGLPLVGLVAWLRARATRHRPMRYAVAEVCAVAGTVPWIWMILTPSADAQRRVGLVPLRDLAQVALADLVVQVGGNLLVFAALGFFLPIRFAIRLSTVLLVAAAASAAVETLQYVLNLGRVSSVDDVLLNASGALLAAICSTPWRRASNPIVAVKQPEPES